MILLSKIGDLSQLSKNVKYFLWIFFWNYIMKLKKVKGGFDVYFLIFFIISIYSLIMVWEPAFIHLNIILFTCCLPPFLHLDWSNLF